jgi:4-amino-4-deoxy-L-arabinose transferase-like glycosyltransferase
MGSVFFGGEPGIGRMFGMSFGTEASWLLPAALIGLAGGLWLTRRAARTDRLRASLLLWGGWLLVSAAVFSFMDGTIHPYYTVALAPAIAALVGISVRELWRVREHLAARLVVAVMSAGTGVWAFVLLDRTPDWLPALRWLVLAGSIVFAVLLAAGAQRGGRVVAVLAAGAVLFAATAPAAYTIETVATVHNGPISTSGPSKGNVFGHSGPGGHDRPGSRIAENAALVEMVQGLDNRWAAAAIGSMGASGLELKTGASIMAIGGFTGSDDSPTLEQFQRYVADHEVRYFIAGESFGPPGRHEGGAASKITSWVEKNFNPMKVGDTTVYDLSAPRT